MAYLIIFVIAFLITSFWVTGIDSMHQKHPDYDGKDLFDEKDN